MKSRVETLEQQHEAQRPAAFPIKETHVQPLRPYIYSIKSQADLERVIADAVAAERNACAEIADLSAQAQHAASASSPNPVLRDVYKYRGEAAESIARCIRARGKTEGEE